MKLTSLVPLTLCCGTLLAEELPDAALLPLAEPGGVARAKVAVFPAQASLDGLPRPELGRSFADSLSAALVKSGQFDVIDAESRLGAEPAKASPVEAAAQVACDTAFAATLVGEGDFFRITVRKLAVPSGKVLDVYEDSATGPASRLFDMVGRAVAQLAPAAPPPSPAPPVRSEPEIGAIRAWMSGPADVEEALARAPRAVRPGGTAVILPEVPVSGIKKGKTTPSGPPPTTTKLTTRVFDGDRQYEIEEIGLVKTINKDYGFAIIDPHPGRAFQSGDKLLMKVEGWRRPTLPGKVSRLNSGHLIVEFDGTLDAQLLPGARAYAWVPEAETDLTPGLPAVPEPVTIQ